MANHVGQAPQVHLSREEHKEWARRLWQRMDRDSSDEITKEELNCDEFQAALKSILAPRAAGKVGGACGRAEINLRQALNYCLVRADENGDGILDFREFEHFLLSLRNDTAPVHIANMTFAMFDLDNSGRIAQEEMREIYQYFVGHFPTARVFKGIWDKLDQAGLNRVSKQTYTRWLAKDAPPEFRDHAPPVEDSERGSIVGGSSTGSRRKRRPIHRPAPGLLPCHVKPKTAQDIQLEWNERFASKDMSEQNLAFRGNLRFRSFFSRPQSLPELHRFYCTYDGFEKNRKKLLSSTDKKKYMVLSTDTWTTAQLPGAERHKAGGTMRNTAGEVTQWAENTPRALIRPVWEPGSLLLRVPGPPPAFLVDGSR